MRSLLFLFLSVSLTIYLPTHLYIYVSIYLSLSLSLSVCLSFYLSNYLSSYYLSIYLSTSICSITPIMTNGLITLCFSELKNESKMTILCSMMVAQQQPKSLQCHYLVEHASQPQTVTVNNQLRTKRSSDFVTLRSKVHGLYLLHAVSCGQKRHASNRTVLHSTCTKQGCLRQCRSDQCWLAETFGGQTKPTTNLSCWKMLCWSDRCCVAKTIRLENTTFSDTIYLSINLSIYLSVYLSVCLSICLYASLKTKRFCETSSVFELGNIKNAAIQQDFLIFSRELLNEGFF